MPTSGDTWSELEECGAARSLPLEVIARYCAGKDVAIAGNFAPFLGDCLSASRVVSVLVPGGANEVISAPQDARTGARRITPDALVASLPACDIVLVTDCGWGDLLARSPAMLTALANRVRDGVILPMQPPPHVAACRWVAGHSWVERGEGNVWLWANSPQSRVEAEICLLRPSPGELTLKFHVMTRPEGNGALTVDVGGRRLSAHVPSDWISVPFSMDRASVPVLFAADIAALRLPHDNRYLSFGIVDMHLVDAEGRVVVFAEDFMQAPNSNGRIGHAARSALHASGFTVVHAVISSSSGYRRERLAATSWIMTEGLDCVDADHGDARPLLVSPSEVLWLFASKTISPLPLEGAHD